MSNLHFLKSPPHYFKHDRQQHEDTVIVTMIVVLVTLLIAGMIYARTAPPDGTAVVSTLSPLPPLIDSIPVHDAGQ